MNVTRTGSTGTSGIYAIFSAMVGLHQSVNASYLQEATGEVCFEMMRRANWDGFDPGRVDRNILMKKG